MFYFQEFVLKQFQENLQQIRRHHIGMAEVKICIIVCYHVIIGCLGLSTATYFTTTRDETTIALQEYFTCQSYDVVPALDCGDFPLNAHPRMFGTLSSISAISISLAPLISLIFSLKCTWTSKCSAKKKNCVHFTKHQSCFLLIPRLHY